MDINALIIFHKVAETNNFSKAGKILDIPISTISRKITKLEEDLNQKLFIRNTRKIHLTIEGQILYEKSKPLFDELYNLPNIFEKDCNLTGDIRITCTIEYKLQLAPQIVEFRKQYPNINLFINFSNDVKDLIEDSYDFAFRAGELKDSSLYSVKLFKDSLCAYIHKDFFPQNINNESLKEFDYCVMENNFLLTFLNGELVKPKKRIVSNSIEFIQEYAKNQASIIYIPELFAGKDFVKINLFQEKTSYFHIVYLHKKLNKPCRLFLEFFKNSKENLDLL